MIVPTLRSPFLALLVAFLAACNATPDKRVLQYLNTDGFGNRYTGNAEEENWVAIGDNIDVTDAFNPELEVPAKVDIDGTVILPEIGAVAVAGLTRTEIEALLMEKYSPYYDRLDIKVRIINTSGKKYFVFGEVEAEGEVPFPGDLTIFEAVMKARPKTDSANLGRVRLIRADPRDPFIQYFDLGEIITRGDSTFNVHVQERDILYVPPTMLAEVGYFLDTLLFPIKYVLTQFSQAIFSYNALQGGGYYGGGNNANGIF